jgi:prepilin-type N-terminal cleavage/methylation domain-containing protein
MSRSRERGFTIAEVMIAVVLLSFGVMAMVGSSAMVTRMIGRGRQATVTGQMATTQLETLRQLAAATSPSCKHASFKTDSVTTGPVNTKWTVPANGSARLVVLSISYQTPRGMVRDTVRTTILCR